MVTSLLMLPGETGADLDRAIARYPTLAGARALLNEFEVHPPAGADELVGRVGSDGRGVTGARECPVHMTMPNTGRCGASCTRRWRSLRRFRDGPIGPFRV